MSPSASVQPPPPNVGDGAPRRAAYHLAPGTHLCLVDDSVVVLDVASDNYAFVDRERTPALLHALGLRELGSDDAEIGSPLVTDTSSVEEMESYGLITRDEEQGKRAMLLDMIQGSSEVPGPHIDAIPRVRLHHVVNMATAVAKALFMVKIVSFDRAVSSVRKLRARAPVKEDRSMESASALVEVYWRLKPLFFSNKDRCLLNSLVLIYFLDRYGHHPYWNFGVRLNPFAAHCWVEDERFLYNDQFCRTFEFKPIMRV